MKRQKVFVINETALMASAARMTRGIDVLDDRPVAIAHPEIFEDSVVKPRPEDSSESSVKDKL